jgi:peptide/nickel transport system permease protein
MPKFIVRRLLLMILTMLMVSIIVFTVTEIAPGNVARKILGAFATPEQEESFTKQLGLDAPAYLRYSDWLIGSDWRAKSLVGMPLKRIKKAGTDYYGWWALDEDGTPVRWKLEEEDLIAMHLQPDGTVVESIDNDRWQTDEEGVSTFWGIDRHDHAILWEKGSGETYWFRAGSAGWWTEKKGGAKYYIPLKKGMLRGDPGKSVQTGRSVMGTLLRRLQNSGILAGLAFAIVMPLAATATPHFATGVFLILIFSSWLKLLPGATVFSSAGALFEKPEMLVLPVLTLTLIELGYVLRITRASMVEVMGTDYIRTVAYGRDCSGRSDLWFPRPGKLPL